MKKRRGSTGPDYSKRGPDNLQYVSDHVHPEWKIKIMAISHFEVLRKINLEHIEEGIDVSGTVIHVDKPLDVPIQGFCFGIRLPGNEVIGDASDMPFQLSNDVSHLIDAGLKQFFK